MSQGLTPPHSTSCIVSTKMYKQRFWMCHFNSATMKRTILWSTGSALAALKPFATMRRKDFKFDTGKSTTDKYINKSGRVAYKGSKHLKSSQCLDDRLVV